jgi:hypothetical protein
MILFRSQCDGKQSWPDMCPIYSLCRSKVSRTPRWDRKFYVGPKTICIYIDLLSQSRCSRRVWFSRHGRPRWFHAATTVYYRAATTTSVPYYYTVHVKSTLIAAPAGVYESSVIIIASWHRMGPFETHPRQ